MAAKMIVCAKLKRELPGIDETTPEGDRALRTALLIGGRELQAKVRETVSAEAWGMWQDHMRMIFNEYRLDPTSDETNKILRMHIDGFFWGEQQAVANYVPPKQ